LAVNVLTLLVPFSEDGVAAVPASPMSPLSIRITQRVGAEDQPSVTLLGPGPHFVGRDAHRSGGWTPSSHAKLLWSKGCHMEIGWKHGDGGDTQYAYAKVLAEVTRNATTHKPGVRDVPYDCVEGACRQRCMVLERRLLVSGRAPAHP
jgi:hypothetical protein